MPLTIDPPAEQRALLSAKSGKTRTKKKKTKKTRATATPPVHRPMLHEIAVAWTSVHLPRQLKPGVGDGLIELGMPLDMVLEVFGEPSDVFPPLDLRDDLGPLETCFLIFGPFHGTRVIDIEFDKPIGEDMRPQKGARVKSIHYIGKAIRGEDHAPLSRTSARTEYGEPDRTGKFTDLGGERKTWEFYNSGLQINYGRDGRVDKVIICPAVDALHRLAEIQS